MNTADGLTINLQSSRPVLILLTLMVTIVVLIVVVNGIRDQRTLVAQQTISHRLYLEEQLAHANAEVEKRGLIVMAQLREEVEGYLAQTSNTRACAAAFGCPEFASNLISEASVFNRKGRRAGAEHSSLGDRILTIGEPTQYEKIITSLNARKPFGWGITKPTDTVRPYCWLTNAEATVICIAVKMNAFATLAFEPIASPHRTTKRINLTLLKPSNYKRIIDQQGKANDIKLARTMSAPLEHFTLSASPVEQVVDTPYWIYPALLALALAASVTGFAAATYRAHRLTVDEAMSKIITMASISHSLRTPLSNLKLYAELLIRHNGDPAAVRNFAMIVDNEASRLTTVIDNVLEIGRPSGQSNLQRANPDDLVQELLLSFGAGKIPNNIKINLTIDRELLFDSHGFQQILVNLVDNARKYAPGEQISVDTWEANNQLFLRIRDFGEQSDKQSTKDITHPYARGEISETDGYGLGLTACKIISERNGGLLTIVRRRPGHCITASLKVHSFDELN